MTKITMPEAVVIAACVLATALIVAAFILGHALVLAGWGACD
jgi:hypothetical protein